MSNTTDASTKNIGTREGGEGGEGGRGLWAVVKGGVLDVFVRVYTTFTCDNVYSYVCFRICTSFCACTCLSVHLRVHVHVRI